MTNRELLQSKNSADLVKWLEEPVAEVNKVPATNWADFPNFSPSEFLCPCGKCAFSTVEGVQDMDYKLLFILQSVRRKYGKPMSITSGARCEEYNATLSNADPKSYHMERKASDFYIKGITSTEAGRNEIVAFMKTLAGYKYSYHNIKGKYPKMGSAIHVEVE